MPYNHVTAFGTTQGNLTDDERLRAQQGMSQAGIAAQMQALQAEIADRQAGRAFQGDQANADRSFQGGMFDKSAGLQKDLDKSATERALGVTGLQMKPSTMAAELERDKYNENADQRAYKHQIFQQMMQGGGPAGVGGAPGGLDPSDQMFLAFNGNPGELANIRRLEMNAKTQRQDAIDNRNFQLGLELLKSPNPQARALGAAMVGKSPASGLAGTDAETLQKGLMPEQDPQTVVTKSPAMAMKLDNAATLLNNASRIGGDDAQIEQAKPILASFIKDLTDQGVKPEEAQAFATAYLKKKLPANATLGGDLLNGLFTVGLGPAIKSWADDRTKVARKVAGLVD